VGPQANERRWGPAQLRTVRVRGSTKFSFRAA
jgi:hypothetical protein